jgi:hypothetical protein
MELRLTIDVLLSVSERSEEITPRLRAADYVFDKFCARNVLREEIRKVR